MKIVLGRIGIEVKPGNQYLVNCENIYENEKLYIYDVTDPNHIKPLAKDNSQRKQLY